MKSATRDLQAQIAALCKVVELNKTTYALSQTNLNYVIGSIRATERKLLQQKMSNLAEKQQAAT